MPGPARISWIFATTSVDVLDVTPVAWPVPRFTKIGLVVLARIFHEKMFDNLLNCICVFVIIKFAAISLFKKRLFAHDILF